MKRILFLAPRNPFSGRYSGDVIRARKFIEKFKKKYSLTVVSLDNNDSKKKLDKIKLITFKKGNIFSNLLFIFINLLMLKPMQFGYFHSSKMNRFIKKNYSNFDIIFCQSIRVAQYVKFDKFKKLILDMGDLYSSNYFQTFKSKNYFNPVKFIYFIESVLMKKYESFCFKYFNKIFLFSKKEIETVGKNKGKIKQINFGVEKAKKRFSFKKTNNRLVFIGNMNYLPNREACRYFSKNIFPKINEIDPEIEFHIVGDISKIDKFLLERNKSTIVHGKVKKLDFIMSKSFCGLANLKVSSGIQTKILTYMSYGLPCVASENVIKNFDALKSSNIPTYKNDDKFIKLILEIKNNKILSEKISRNSLRIISKFKWEKVLNDLKF